MREQKHGEKKRGRKFEHTETAKRHQPPGAYSGRDLSHL